MPYEVGHSVAFVPKLFLSATRAPTSAIPDGGAVVSVFGMLSGLNISLSPFFGYSLPAPGHLIACNLNLVK